MWRGRWRVVLRRRAGVLRRRTRCLPLWHRLAMLLWRTAVVVSAPVSAVVGATLIAVVTLVASSISRVVLRRRGKGRKPSLDRALLLLRLLSPVFMRFPEFEFPRLAAGAFNRASLGDMAGAWYSPPAARAGTAA